MKTIYHQILMLCALLTLISSCNKDEPSYSCEPALDEWAKSNLETIQRMDRHDFLQLPTLDYQRTAFKIFSPEQRMVVWTGKIDNLLKLGEWNAEEREHLTKLRVLISNHKSWFVNNVEKSNSKAEADADAIDIEAYLWIDYSIEKLGWDNNKIMYVVSNPNDGFNYPQPLGGYVCNCSTAWSLFCWGDDVCTKGYKNCYDSDGMGCGWLMLSACNGRCKGLF